MPKLSSSTFAKGARQFVVQEAFEMMWCSSLLYWSSFTPMTMVMSSFLAGAEMTTFLAPASRCALALVAVGEEAGGLHDHVHAQLAPGEVGRLAFGEHLDRMAVGDEPVLGHFHVLEGAAVDGVVLQQVGHRRDVAEVVDGNDLDVGVVHHGAERQASYAAESVNANFGCHAYPLS